MKKLKRFLALALTCVMALAMLTACGGSSGSGNGSQSAFINMVNENLSGTGITVEEDTKVSAALKKYIDASNEYSKFIGIKSEDEARKLTDSEINELELNVEDKYKQATLYADLEKAYQELMALDGMLAEADEVIEGTLTEQVQLFAESIKQDEFIKTFDKKKVVIGYYQFTFGKDYVIWYTMGYEN